MKEDLVNYNLQNVNSKIIEGQSPSPKRKKRFPLIDNNMFSAQKENLTALPRFVTIKRKEDNFERVSPFLIQKLIYALLGKIKTLRKTKAGTLLLETATDNQSKIILSTTLLGDFPVTVYPHERLNSSRGVIYCRDFLCCTDEEIIDGLKDQNVTDVRQIEKKFGVESRKTPLYILTFSQPTPPTEIQGPFYNLKVRRYIPAPLRCFKCLKFGHISNRCRGEANCNCGRPSHEGTECQSPPVCVNCKGDHTTRSPRCPEFIAEKEIQRLKTEQQMPYHEARKIVRGKSYVKQPISFAVIAAKSNYDSHANDTSKKSTPSQSSSVNNIQQPNPEPKFVSNISRKNNTTSTQNNEETPTFSSEESSRKPSPGDTPSTSSTPLDSPDNIPFTKVKGKKGRPKGDSQTCSING